MVESETSLSTQRGLLNKKVDVKGMGCHVLLPRDWKVTGSNPSAIYF